MTPPAAAVAPRRVLLDGLTFPECPRWHDDRLWLSDVHAHRVLRVDSDGAVEEVARLDGERPAGLGFLPDGSLLIVGLTSRTLLRVAVTGGEPAPYADLRGLCAGFLNDMVVDAEGRAYVGSRNGGASGTDSIVLVEPGGAARVVAENLTSPNGMVVTPAGDELIVAETRLGRLTRYALGTDGALSDRRTRAVADRQILDGICLDAEGAVWGAAGPAGALRFDACGRQVDAIEAIDGHDGAGVRARRARAQDAVPGRHALRPRRAGRPRPGPAARRAQHRARPDRDRRGHARRGRGAAVSGTLAGRVALVTGAGRGIGRGVALELAAEGAHVVAAARTRERIEAVADEIRAAGGSALAVPCDVADRAQVLDAVAAAVDAFGTVDILANVAQGFSTVPGQGLQRHALEDYPEPEWDHLFQTGLKGTLYAMQAVFGHMRDRGGKIVNVGSEVGQRGGDHAAAYAANKEAIRALTRSAAREWGRHGINVNVINPVIETEASSWTADAELRAQVVGSTSLKRVASPRECGRVVAFLAGPDSDYLTGMTLMVDGGRFLFA